MHGRKYGRPITNGKPHLFGQPASIKDALIPTTVLSEFKWSVSWRFLSGQGSCRRLVARTRFPVIFSTADLLVYVTVDLKRFIDEVVCLKNLATYQEVSDDRKWRRPKETICVNNGLIRIMRHFSRQIDAYRSIF